MNRKTSLIKKVQKLSLQNGDVLVIYAKRNGLSSLGHISEEVIALKQYLNKTARGECGIIVLGPDVKLEHLSPQEMLKLGWVKIDA